MAPSDQSVISNPIPPQDRDPDQYVRRNGQTILNPAHFVSFQPLEKQAQARTLLEQIYASPVESQALIADILVRENEELAPFMAYEATKTGHVDVNRAIWESGKVASAGLDFDQYVAEHQTRRAKEVFAVRDDDAREELVRAWVEEFEGEQYQLLFEAAIAGHVNVIQQLHQMDVLGQARENLSDISLNGAAHHGHLDCVEYLLSQGMHVNGTDEEGGTPLMRAAVGGRVEVVKWLLEHGADPCIRETREGNYNALDYGAGQSADITRLLIEPCGFSPAAMVSASSFGNEESFDIVVEAGAFPVPPEGGADARFWDNTLTGAQRDVVLQSLWRGNGGSVKILTWLLQYIPKSEIRGDDIRKALEDNALHAIVDKRTASFELMVKFLVGDGKELTDDQRNLLASFFVQSAGSNAIDCLDLLIKKYGVDVNCRDHQPETTALYSAARVDAIEAIDHLAGTLGADIHQASGQFSNGPTALWLAVEQQHEKSTRALLSHGGPVEAIDPLIEQGVTNRVYVSAVRSHRAPVELHAEMDPEWDDEDSRSRFLCLEYPDGWPGGVQLRKADAELKDERPLRLPEDDGFVVL